eukprot:TRINITY_DN3365_c0_g1_i1.p1 TRINITY_DN3365_c0_g1~~TRINITY_DN3365_c0_g1_i1.p1  ORF type:complete len:324 (-),score=81.30 TRINITY_DN3365_c0_g1_i1:22-972(-)
MLPRVVQNNELPHGLQRYVEAVCTSVNWEEAEKTDLEERKQIQGAYVYGHKKVDGAAMDLFPNLKVISGFGVGVDHIDVEEATKRGIAVGNTPEVLDDTVADMTFALILSAARNVVIGDEICRAPDTVKYDNSFWGVQVSHSTIGIVGMGRIGLKIAQRAKGFSMSIAYHNRHRDETAEKQTGAEYMDKLDDLLAASDFVVLMVPLTESTKKMISDAQFAKMKSNAILINMARGGVVDHDALTRALDEGKIRGAGLDVTDPEPLNRDHPLLKNKKVVFTPHSGSATLYAREKMAALSARNLHLGLEGKRLERSPQK